MIRLALATALLTLAACGGKEQTAPTNEAAMSKKAVADVDAATAEANAAATPPEGTKPAS